MKSTIYFATFSIETKY